MADLLVDSHVIAAFRNRTNTLDAISELADNAFDAGASTFTLWLGGQGKVIAVDDGKGTKDLNPLFKLGGSKSQNSGEAIGRYGIGAKEAMLHFGSVVEVESVCKGQYRKHKIDWDRVEKHGTQVAHSGRTVPRPESFKGDGTLICITRLAAGRARVHPETLMKRLSHRYRPALRKNKTFEIDFGHGLCKLSHDAEAIGAWKNEREIIGIAADRPFSIRYTDLKEYDPAITGIHIAYGNRFIEHLKKIEGKTLPPLFYAEVMLGHKWKDCLSANKTSIVQYRDELETEVHNLLKDWIKQLETFADEARIEKLNLLLQTHTAQIFTFKSAGAGFKCGPKIAVAESNEHRDDPVDDPEPDKEEQEAIPDDSGDGDRQPKKRRPSGLNFKRDDTLGKMPFYIDSDLVSRKLTVFLNGAIPAVDIAYRVPYKIPALWPLISAAFAGWIRENIKSVDELIPGFIDMLGNVEGYPTDRENPIDLELYVLHWMMRQHPPAQKELEKLEEAI